MSAMDLDSDVSTVLATIRSQTEDSQVHEATYQLEDLYEMKLWNQLTLLLQEVYEYPQAQEDNFRMKMFDLFITKFQNKLNYLCVIDFLIQSFRDPALCLEKLEVLQNDIVSDLKKQLSSRRLDDLDQQINDDEAVVYIRLQTARYALLKQDLTKAELVLETVSDKFENTLQNDYSSKINAAYYLTKCEYYKYYENWNLIYTNGLLYLSSIEKEMPQLKKVEFCYMLCVSALLGDKIYNFGELILHDILKSIASRDSPYYWLYNLIQTLNLGNLPEFTRGLNEDASRKSPQLWAQRDFLKQKIVIMSLLELILFSSKQSADKTFSFGDISAICEIPIDEVELFVIKCFSLGLIKGHINQLQQVLVVTWMQPRVLNLDQVKSLYNRLVDWNGKVGELSKEVYASGGSFWA